jgi:serine/threonine protein kinase
VDGFWFEGIEDEGISRTFIQMELCQGTLAEYLSKTKDGGEGTRPLDILEMMAQILDGLAYCHKIGICHRDLKLSNGVTSSYDWLINSTVCQ